MKKNEQYVCPARNTCPYEYDACTDPTKFCRIIEDTPEHYSKELLKKHEELVKRMKNAKI